MSSNGTTVYDGTKVNHNLTLFCFKFPSKVSNFSDFLKDCETNVCS